MEILGPRSVPEAPFAGGGGRLGEGTGGVCHRALKVGQQNESLGTRGKDPTGSGDDI